MGKELVYLGERGALSLVALADVFDLATRTVPVKEIPTVELTKAVKGGVIKLRGYIKSTSKLEEDTHVRVACVKILGGRADVFISATGKFRLFHTGFMAYLSNTLHFVMRQSVTERPVSCFKNLVQPAASSVYEAYLKEQIEDVAAFMAQQFLLNGLWVVGNYSASGIWAAAPVEIHPIDGRCSVCIEKVVCPLETVSWIIRSCVIHISELHIKTRFTVTARGSAGLTCHKLYVYKGAHIMCTGMKVDKIISGYDDDDSEKFNINDDTHVTDLAIYTGADMLCDAEGIVFDRCFAGYDEQANDINGDVYIPANILLNYCFKGANILGNVLIGSNAFISSSFTDAKMHSVISSPQSVKSFTRQIVGSFKGAEIQGDVDISTVRDIDSSFTGDIWGTVKLSSTLRTLLGKCFTNYNQVEYVIRTNEENDNFCAGLECGEASLTVYGDVGNFEYVNVKNLTWITNATKLKQYDFRYASVNFSSPVSSIKEIDSSAFEFFAGRLLDFRLFPNLDLINTRAVSDCQNLLAVVITGNVTLSPSAFIRCNRLKFVFIGDEVKGVVASVFNNCAAVTKIYYGKNAGVARLSRLPRFEVVPNSTPEDVLALLDERAEHLENASILAGLAGVDESISMQMDGSEKNSVLCATVLALNETGYNADLSKLYPIVKKCEVPMEKVSWAVNTLAVAKGAIFQREKVERVFIALLTVSYPYCEAVLRYKKSSSYRDFSGKVIHTAPMLGQIVFSGTDYDIVCSDFRVSGKISKACVIIEKASSTIIHAFTVGPERDVLAASIGFLNLVEPNAVPCAVLRYAEDEYLHDWWGSYSNLTYEKMRDVVMGFVASWVPFGVFRLGGTLGMYGVDLFNGGIVAYQTTETRGKCAELSKYLAHLEHKGRKYEIDPSTLKSPYIGSCDRELALLCDSENLKKVTEYDRTMVPIAADEEMAQKLWKLFKASAQDKKPTVSVIEAGALFSKSELFKAAVRSRIKLSTAPENTIMLIGGRIEFYRVDTYQIPVVALISEDSGTTTFYLSICTYEKLVDFLYRVKNKNPSSLDEKNKHCTLSQDYQMDKIHILATYDVSGWHDSFKKSLCICVSLVSYKACVCFIGSEGKKLEVLYWFNSIQDACKVAAIYGFNLFSVKAKDTNLDRRMRRQTNSFADKSDIATRNAIKAGYPNGYILQDVECNQEIFDLACKQPALPST